MHVYEELQAVGASLCQLVEPSFDGVDYRVEDWIRVTPSPVGIVPCVCAPRVAIHDAIHVDHGHHVEDKLLA